MRPPDELIAALRNTGILTDSEGLPYVRVGDWHDCHDAADLIEEMTDFLASAEHDAGCSGSWPPHTCRCGLRSLRLRLGLTPEPGWTEDVEQPTT